MFGKSVLLLFGACFIFHSASSVPTLECLGVLGNGEHVGKFVGIISKQEWTQTNYLFQPDGALAPKCVEFDELSNPIRAKLILAAYLTKSNVKIHVNGNHDITGIAFENKTPADSWFVTDIDVTLPKLL